MAESETPPPGTQEDDVDALEKPDGGNVSDQVIDATGGQAVSAAKGTGDDSRESKQSGFKRLLQRFNIYLLLFIFILVLAGGVLVIAYFQAKQASNTTIKAQDLTQNTLQQLAASDATIGSNPQQVLNVQSSAVFAGKVLVRDGLEIAGSLKVGGTTVLNDLAVSGTGQFGQIQVSKNLSVTGDEAIQGSLTIAKSLQVSGGGSFSGAVSAPQLTTSSLQLNGDLVLTHHISAGGPSPSLARGTSLGSGGSASLSGSDISGSVSINIGSSPAAGCFATITFAAKYNSTPRVLLTPVGADAGTIDYYVSRTTGSFTICDATAPAAGTSFGFDYFIIN